MNFLFLLLLFHPSSFAVAVPATSTTASDSNTTTTNKDTTTHKPTASRRPHRTSHVGLPTSNPAVGKFSSQSFDPTATPGPNPPFPAHHSSDSHQKPLVTFFEVLGGVVAFILLVGILRCIVSYKKTPNLDRVSYFIDRHQIQQEMEERGRASRRIFRSSLVEPPPPPYLPPPPNYDQDDSTTPLTVNRNPPTSPTPHDDPTTPLTVNRTPPATPTPDTRPSQPDIILPPNG